MNIVVPLPISSHEKRVALTPKMAQTLCTRGMRVTIESGAGEGSFFRDTAYQAVGIEVVQSIEDLLKDAQVVLPMGPMSPEQVALLPEHASVVGLLGGHALDASLYMRKKSSVFSLELLPRTSRAQEMDVLSSQGTLYGYWAAVYSSTLLPRLFPMMITAAGSVPPAHVLVLGGGVIGLQALATARRLGAIVSVFDVRPAVKEQVESLGGSYVVVDIGETSGETSAGYAKEMTASYQQRQKDAIVKLLPKIDVVICSAFVFGKQPPIILDEEMVHVMKPGSVIIDIAADRPDTSSGCGNCALSKKGEITESRGVKIVAPLHGLSNIAQDASRFYAGNIAAFVNLLKGAQDTEGKFSLDRDEILAATCLVHRGRSKHEGGW